MGQGSWDAVKHLFNRALQMPPEQRREFLLANSSEGEVLHEVISLISSFENDPDFLNATTPLDGHTFGAPHAAGALVGPWRLIREAGRGGMGVVWEAERCGDGFAQRAAIKFVHNPVFGYIEVERLREERRILAGLEHPSIARLLDGGTTSDGAPYLVMEFVDGEPIDRWCESRDLGVRERLGLFLEVCAAVEYAHRHLVVHRDLKPANILVTEDGAVKLLDFGIAKLLGADQPSAPTATAARLLTPEYASPEQVRGDRVTTATDVYSLGVVLFTLLCGRKPYTLENSGPLEFMKAICEQDPPQPSSVAEPPFRRHLRGELDAVILQSLRKQPSERYSSVAAFAADIRAWLDGRPVAAHPASLWRRTRKFFLRHKAASIAAAVAVVAILAGSGATAWQAQVATQQRARAERRFAQVRQFSRSLLFELHEAMRDLPGATAARNLLLTRATSLLDSLAADADDDTALQVELAEGYRRLGHVLGSTLSDNLGRRAEAIAAYDKAVHIAENALSRTPDYAPAALVLLGAYDDLTEATYMQGDATAADQWFDRHRTLLARLDTPGVANPDLRLSIATSYASLGFHHARTNQLASARSYYQIATARFASLAAGGSTSRKLLSHYAFALKRLGAIEIKDNTLDLAERHYREALALEDRLLAQDAANATTRIDRTFTQSDLALILKKRGVRVAATRLYEDVLASRSAALAADPENPRLLGLTASVQSNLAALYSDAGRHVDAVQRARIALELRRRVFAKTASPRDEAQVAGAGVSFAERLRDAGYPSAALNQLGQIRPIVQRLRSQSPGAFEASLIVDYDAISAALAADAAR